jgi:predicted PurR-regulated permease PerM
VLTISAQIGMGLLFGAGGVVVATPMAAAALVAVTRLYIEDALEKPR